MCTLQYNQFLSEKLFDMFIMIICFTDIFMYQSNFLRRFNTWKQGSKVSHVILSHKMNTLIGVITLAVGVYCAILGIGKESEMSLIEFNFMEFDDNQGIW